jgi:putative transposase
MGILRMILAFLRTFVASRANLAAENMLLRQQLIVLQRSVPRLKLRRTDRVVLCWLSRLWTGWRSALLIVQPATIVRWHREGFKLYWRWKSRKKPGRPKIDAEVRNLIRRMSQENPTARRRKARSLPMPTSVACITATRGRPDERTETSWRIDGGRTLRLPGTQGASNCSRA